MTEAEFFIASIRTRVGQIKKAQENPTAGSWLQIDLACDKLLDEASTFERRTTPLPRPDRGSQP